MKLTYYVKVITNNIGRYIKDTPLFLDTIEIKNAKQKLLWSKNFII